MPSSGIQRDELDSRLAALWRDSAADARRPPSRTVCLDVRTYSLVSTEKPLITALLSPFTLQPK